MLNAVTFTYFLVKLGDRGVLLLGLEEALQVLDLTPEVVIHHVIKIVPKDEPHAYAEDGLGQSENGQVPERETHADRKSSHICCPMSTVPCESYIPPRARYESV